MNWVAASIAQGGPLSDCGASGVWRAYFLVKTRYLPAGETPAGRTAGTAVLLSRFPVGSAGVADRATATKPWLQRARRDLHASRTRKMPDSVSRPAFPRCVSNQTKTELCAIRLIFFGLHAFPCEGLHGMSEIPKDLRVSRRPIQTTTGVVIEFLLRKEVIQPQVPLRLPCYDFIPVTAHSVGRCPHCWLARALRLQVTSMM